MLANRSTLPVIPGKCQQTLGKSTLWGALKKTIRNISKEEFTAAECMLDRIMQLADNACSIDELSELIYLAVRYDAIYSKANEMHQCNFSLIRRLQDRPKYRLK